MELDPDIPVVTTDHISIRRKPTPMTASTKPRTRKENKSYVPQTGKRNRWKKSPHSKYRSKLPLIRMAFTNFRTGKGNEAHGQMSPWETRKLVLHLRTISSLKKVLRISLTICDKLRLLHTSFLHKGNSFSYSQYPVWRVN